MKYNKKTLDLLYDYIKFLKKSWTYNKLTKKEKDTFEHIFYSEQIKEILKGTENQKKLILNFTYSVFLAGVGYSGNDWRKTEQQPF